MNKLSKVVIFDPSKIKECPECGANWDGGSIVETFIKQRDSGVEVWKGMSDEEIEKDVKKSYSEPYRWQRVIGVELSYDHPEHRDGVSYWQCPDCESFFNRFK